MTVTSVLCRGGNPALALLAGERSCRELCVVVAALVVVAVVVVGAREGLPSID